jgi:FMN phosphatase YigB (HAD superfamily)
MKVRKGQEETYEYYENLAKENKNIIIFDFDATFYSGKNVYCYVKDYVDKNRRKFLPNITNEQYDEICKDNPSWLEQIAGKDIVNSIYKLKNKYPDYKIDTYAFWQCQQDQIYNINLEDAQKVDANFIKNICKKYHTYIVSNSSPNHIYHYMNELNINPNWFVKIISNHFIESDPTKEHYYLKIAKQEQIDPKYMLVFGDSDISDLVPARNIGAKAYLVKNSNDINEIVTNALKNE